MISVGWDISIIFGLVGLNGFFVATEFALVSIRRSRVEELISLGNRRAHAVKRAIDNLDRYIAGTQVGITLASLALGWLGEPLIAEMLHELFLSFPAIELSEKMTHSVAIVIAFLGITALHVILGELVPKSLALQMPETVSLFVSRPMAFIVVLFHPLIWCLNGIGNALLRAIGIQAAGTHASVHSVEELQILVQQTHEAGMLDETEQQVLQRSFRFAELSVKDIMVRRIDVVSLDLTEPKAVLLEKAAAAVHSRLPVCVNSLDSIVGVLHIRDLFRAFYHDSVPDDLSQLCRPLRAIPENAHLDGLLDFFREHRTQIAAVIDEHGGTAGLVTFEDLVEEVTGEIQDEFETEEKFPQHLPDGRVILKGDTRLEDAREILAWELADESVDTLAGYIMNHLGRVAKVDDEVKTECGTLKVIDMARRRITRVSAKRAPAIPDSPSEG